MARNPLPQLTAEQREHNRMSAIEARKERARMLSGVRDGRVDPQGVLMRRDRVARRTRVEALMKAVPGVGPSRAEAAMRELGISPRRRVGGLGPRQRERLGAWLAARKG